MTVYFCIEVKKFLAFFILKVGVQPICKSENLWSAVASVDDKLDASLKEALHSSTWGNYLPHLQSIICLIHGMSCRQHLVIRPLLCQRDVALVCKISYALIQWLQQLGDQSRYSLPHHILHVEGMSVTLHWGRRSISASKLWIDL